MREPILPGFSVKDRDEDGRHTLLLTGELDLAGAPILEAAILQTRAGRTRGITLDLGELTFLDVSGLHAIVFAAELCERHGYGFSLIPGPATVQRLFELTGFIDVLPFVEENPDIQS